MTQPSIVQRQNGYGAYKRGEYCEVCLPIEGKEAHVGTWRAQYDDGRKRFFCDTHVTSAFASASQTAPAEPEPQSTT